MTTDANFPSFKMQCSLELYLIGQIQSVLIFHFTFHRCRCLDFKFVQYCIDAACQIKAEVTALVILYGKRL